MLVGEVLSVTGAAGAARAQDLGRDAHGRRARHRAALDTGVT
jgi:hypothetical protein